ncbi:hypothetical protein DIPPA_35235 [Diplonema papillatum]|nr:hypothetical protein DIPPA_07229 [Diplonema papillatum]KAJ9439176.1 hypothetical protein DIPPA_35235 [Diplonema papillatum]|eukprot:gene8436-12998_t
MKNLFSGFGRWGGAAAAQDAAAQAGAGRVTAGRPVVALKVSEVKTESSVPTPAERAAASPQPASKLSGFKKEVGASQPCATEVVTIGKLYQVKELPRKVSKGKEYQVYELRSPISPHLLPAAANNFKAWGAHPGLFTRDQRTGRPKNIRFEEALQDLKVMEDIWLLVFVPSDKTAAFLERLKSALLDSVTGHLGEVATSEHDRFVLMKHAGNEPAFEFEEGKKEMAIVYEVSGEITDVLYAVATLLDKKGYRAALVTSMPDGTPRKPLVIVTIPAAQEGKLAAFPGELRTAGSKALATYRDVLSRDLKDHIADTA